MNAVSWACAVLALAGLALVVTLPSAWSPAGMILSVVAAAGLVWSPGERRGQRVGPNPPGGDTRT